MKRQKRDRSGRAFSRGYQAGLRGHSQDICPYSTLTPREMWLGGWREGWEQFRTGYINGG